MMEAKGWEKAATFWDSCRHAWRGLVQTFHTERNFRTQLVLGLLAIGFGWALGLSALKLAMLVMMATVVLALEIINTSLEMLADVVQPTYHDRIGLLKDMTAGAVLAASVGALVVGLLVFVPEVMYLVGLI